MALTVFRASPRGQLYDSRYTLLVSHQLRVAGDPRLDPWIGALGGVSPSGTPRDYRIVRHGDALHWFYPAGTPLLALPFVALADALGHGPVDPAGAYDRGAERRLQRWLAALAMAGATLLFFGIARAWLAPGASAVVAATGAFASPIYSTASRSLWSQSGEVLLVTGAVLLLARRVGGARPLRPVALGSLLAWAWLCRPTAAVPALAVTVYVAVRHREALPALLLTGVGWLGAFLLFDRVFYDSWLPPYHALGSHSFGFLPEALLGNWLSPARGLLVYSPIVAAVGLAAILARRRLPSPALAVLAAAVVLGHWLLVSSHAPWWGGYGYGPRLMTETVPWLVLLGTLAWAGARAAGRRASPALATAIGALIALSIAMHAVGAVSRAAADWNHRQGRPGFDEALWRWRDAPFLAPVRGTDAADDASNASNASAEPAEPARPAAPDASRAPRAAPAPGPDQPAIGE